LFIIRTNLKSPNVEKKNIVKLSQKSENETEKKKVAPWNFQVNNVGFEIIVKFHFCKNVLRGGTPKELLSPNLNGE